MDLQPQGFARALGVLPLRALFFLVAALSLAACSSSIPPSIGNSQALNNTVRLPSVDPNHLTLQFEDIAPNSLLSMYADPLKLKCITSVEPDFIHLFDGQDQKVDIKGDNQGGCEGGFREVHFATGLVEVSGFRIWRGDLHLQYNPQLAAWVAKLYPGDHNTDLCTEPRGFSEGTHVKDDELIKIFFCN